MDEKCPFFKDVAVPQRNQTAQNSTQDTHAKLKAICFSNGSEFIRHAALETPPPPIRSMLVSHTWTDQITATALIWRVILRGKKPAPPSNE